MPSDREAILARRALFLATTLGGLAPREAGADEPAAPSAPPAAPPAAPPRAWPSICLSDDPIETERTARPERPKFVTPVEPTDLAPMPRREAQSHVQVCLSIDLSSRYLRLRRTPHLALSLDLPTAHAAAAPSDAGASRVARPGAGVKVQVNGALSASWDLRGGLAFDAALYSPRSSLWQRGVTLSALFNINTRLWSSLGGTYGYLTVDDPLSPLRSSAFFRLEIAPIGVRLAAAGVEVGPRLLLTASAVERGGEPGRGLSIVSGGVWLTYLFLQKEPED